MTIEYKKRATRYEVWAVIRARHYKELTVFSSYSAPEGDYNGNPSEAVMMTEYGFKEADCPIIGARTTWNVGDKTWPRDSEQTKYWLCLPVEQN